MSEPNETSTSWDMSQERAFTENLFCQRFNFFLVVFSLVAAGAAAANTQAKLVSILWIGFVICFLLALTIYRNYIKLDWIHRELHKVGKHPIHVVGEGIKPLGACALFRVNWIIGVLIPVLSCIVLLLGGIAAGLCKLKAI